MRVEGSGFRVQGSGCRVQGPGFRVKGSTFETDMLPRFLNPDSALPLRFAFSVEVERFGFRVLGLGVYGLVC